MNELAQYIIGFFCKKLKINFLSKKPGYRFMNKIICVSASCRQEAPIINL